MDDAPEWHTAILENNIKLAYIDSGNPSSNNNYTTLVCVHGHTYHAQIFKRLFPLAKKHNLRIVAINRRDYDGSTLFTPQELRVLNGSNAAQHTDFLKERGLEIARFLTYLVKKEDIPKKSEDGKSGGIALLGWSAGNYTTLAFLAHLDTYPDEIRDVLKTHVRAQIVYEIAFNGLGASNPPNAYHPLFDTSIPEHSRGIAFGTWMSSYFTHPYFASPTSSANLPKALTSLQSRTPPERPPPAKPATIDAMDEDDLFDTIDVAPGNRSEKAFYTTIGPGTLRAHIDKALLLAPASSGDGNAEAEVRIPDVDVKVRVMYGTATVWTIVWGVWEFEKILSAWKEEGKSVRDVEIVKVEGANHFLQYDDPETFLDVIVKSINN